MREFRAAPFYRLLVLAGVSCLFVACGAADGPTAPTAAPRATDALGLADGPTALGDPSLRGMVRDAVTGLPVPGARVEAADLSAVETDGNGLFSIPANQAGIVALVARADGYFPHQTHARTETGTPIVIEVIPENGKFDLNFYDHVFRNLGENGSYIWATEPRFEILSQVFDCVDHETTDACDVFEATDEAAPGQFVSLTREVVTADVSRYTGGALAGSDVRLVDVAPGTRITRSEAWVRDKVRFLIARMPDGSSWTTRWIYRGTSDYYSAFIIINKSTHKAERGVYSHELAHSLGYSHPLGGDRVPIWSIMRYGHGPDPYPADILHGAILYRRPAGSRTPDQDPDDFVVNGLRQLPMGAGDLISETIR